MEAERWKRVEELFHLSLDLEASERAGLLERECAGDAPLREEVERLLREDAESGDLFDELEQRSQAVPTDPMVGRTLGAWRLVERLAVGGMGVVYRAERIDGLFAQQVAIKLIRSERATDGLIRRFELERRTLAALQHPCIARLYDGGTADDGRPFLVMELVHGVPIDRHCDQARLSVAERVRLFVQVCWAVHFAHQNLVVHRDLKPANILIDERGAPKLLDFGIARLLLDDEDGALQDATRTLARILTPEYASPEQLAGGPVTTAIDVYALGVVLYEILTGRKPFRCDSRSPLDWERAVSERAPERPSTVVARPATAGGGAAEEPDPLELARRLGSTPRGLERRLRGDLDRIVLMALRKEPERRYSSAQALADDLERHLAGEPVLARGDSLWYRTSKFVRRNRVAVVSAVAVAGALLAGLIATLRSERRAQRLAESAIIEAASFQGLAEFLEETFLTATVARDRARLHLAQESVLEQAERVRRQYHDQDPTRANLLDALGQVCARLDLFEDAERLMREALELRERTFGSRSLERAQSLQSLGQLDYLRGEYASAAQRLREALELYRQSAGEERTDVSSLANDLAACLRHTGQDEEAAELHLEALELRRGVEARSLPVAESLNNLSAIHMDRAEFALAAERLQEALEIRSSILGQSHPLTLQTSSNLAGALWQLGRRAEARELLQATEAGYRALEAEGEEGLGGALSNLAWMDLDEGNIDRAEKLLGEALDLQSARLGSEHPAVAEILAKLAQVQHARGRDEEARALWEQALEIRRAPSASPRDLAAALYAYAVLLCDLRSFAEAVPLLEEALTIFRSLSSTDPLAVGRAELVLARCLAVTAQPSDAVSHLREAQRLLDQSGRATPEELARVRQGLEELAAGGGN